MGFDIDQTDHECQELMSECVNISIRLGHRKFDVRDFEYLRSEVRLPLDRFEQFARNKGMEVQHHAEKQATPRSLRPLVHLDDTLQAKMPASYLQTALRISRTFRGMLSKVGILPTAEEIMEHPDNTKLAKQIRLYEDLANLARHKLNVDAA